jgi:hypothetical protein
MIARGFKKILLGVGILSLSILPAGASNLLNTTFPGSQTFSNPGLLKIFNSGSFTQSFSVSQAKTVMISFSAVCSIGGTTNQTTTIQILVDGTATSPTNQGNDLLCSAVGAAVNSDGRARNTVVTARQVGVGNHNIQVSVTPHNGGISRIDALVLLVWD